MSKKIVDDHIELTLGTLAPHPSDGIVMLQCDLTAVHTKPTGGDVDMNWIDLDRKNVGMGYQQLQLSYCGTAAET